VHSPTHFTFVTISILINRMEIISVQLQEWWSWGASFTS